MLEQYRLTVEMSDRLSARRASANSFFVTLNAALLTAAEALDLKVAAWLGVALAATWWLLLRSYRRLNAAKWVAIDELERELPRRPFAVEWQQFKRDPLERRFLLRYAELTIVEQTVPAVVALLYVLVFVQAL